MSDGSSNPAVAFALRAVERDAADVVRARGRLVEDVRAARRLGIRWRVIGAAAGITESGARAIAAAGRPA